MNEQNDTIYRQDAIDYFFRPYSNEEVYTNSDIREALLKLPPAQPQRMHGRWIWIDATNSLICSKCKNEAPMRSDFCPNCGADMKEE